jgi:predicted kinase
MQRPDHPFLILTCGLTGTGKTTIAAALADRWGATLIRSDAVRKELVGIEPERHDMAAFGDGIYSEDYFEKTYKLLFESGRLLLEKGESAILDASFKKKQYRTKARRIAEDLGTLFLLVECTCPEEETRRRLGKRLADKTDISDGRWEIYAAQKSDFESVDEIAESEHLVLDTSESLENNVNKVLEKLEALSQN